MLVCTFPGILKTQVLGYIQDKLQKPKKKVPDFLGFHCTLSIGFTTFVH